MAKTSKNIVDENYVLVRSRDAGVHVGRLIRRNHDEVELQDSRRIWYWDGAATLSELALYGTSKPDSCKFPVPVPQIVIFGVCELIPVTKEALDSIRKVPVWSER